MKLQIYLFAMITIAMLSCQKSYSPGDLPGGRTSGGGSGSSGSGTAAFLSKLVLESGGATVTYSYEYTSAGKVNIIGSSTIYAGQAVTTKIRFLRDNTGKLVQYSQKVNVPGYPDSVLFTYHYSAGATIPGLITSNYTTTGGLHTRDSIVLTVANGLITAVTSYGNYDDQGYEFVSGATFSYNTSGNITQIKDYESQNGSGTPTLNNVTTYEYDTNQNPLPTGPEAFVIGGMYGSKNNVVKAVNTDYTSSTTGVVTTSSYVFTYNSNNLPGSSIGTDSPGGAKLNSTYSYW